jgi:hypothetical protein
MVCLAGKTSKLEDRNVAIAKDLPCTPKAWSGRITDKQNELNFFSKSIVSILTLAVLSRRSRDERWGGFYFLG